MNEREDENQDRKYFVYREAASSEELEALLRLRYQVYSGCNLAKFVHENELGFELDAYDFRSRHFGMFLVEHGVETPIGYLRVVEDNDLSNQPQVTALAAKYADHFGEINSQVPAPFPVFTYSPDAQVMKTMYQEMLALDEKAVEPTRMGLLEVHRSRRMGRLLFECSVAIYFFTFGVDHVFACCDSSKKAFYHLYEWNHIPGTRECDFAGLGESSVCLHGSAAGTPDKVRPRILAMAEAFRSTGRICYFPNNPNVFVETQVDRVEFSSPMSHKAVA